MASVDTQSSSSNGLVCFTNCWLAQEDGSIVQKDLWIDDRRGVILDAQRTFFLRKERPDTVIDLGGNILSPGLLDIQINGAYGFDFSVYTGDDAAYRDGLDMIARRIIETGVTALLPTIITQSSELYPRLLHLLRPHTPAPSPDHPHGGATLLGWHSEGPFLSPTKRGAHSLPLLRDAARGITDVESVYGASALAHHEDWVLQADLNTGGVGVRMVTLAPELPGMLDRDRGSDRGGEKGTAAGVITELTRRGVSVSIGHSVAGADTAARAVRKGARMVTHLFNAMPQLHHRDPGIIGLLGASPASLVSTGLKKSKSSSTTPPPKSHESDGGPVSPSSVSIPSARPSAEVNINAPESSFVGAVESVEAGGAEALDENDTPPHTPIFRSFGIQTGDLEVIEAEATEVNRPFYGMIVDGVHLHPNSVRLAYTAHKDGCILVTDAMKILDPNMPDGTYDWREGRRVVKEGARLYIEGTDTLAGSVVTLDTCLRNFVRFTGCTLGQALKCVTYNPAKCLRIENKKGTLRPDADADLVVLDRNGGVLSTWVRGRQVWKKQ